MNLLSMIQAIAKREDVSPIKGLHEYGNVTYADPTNKRYPIETKAHTKAAWSYINMPRNASKYKAEDLATIKGRIRAAAKKFGIEISDDQGNGDKKAESSLCECDVAYPIEMVNEEPPQSIMFFPQGKQRIFPLINGKPASSPIDLDIDASVVGKLQADLEKRQADNVRPHGNFDHRPGAAAFLPKKFHWKDGEGIYLDLQWTGSGQRAIKDKDYSYFSPTFILSPEGKIAGLPQSGAIGSLTNDPAFRSIKRIAAARVGPDDDDQGDNMTNPVITQCVALGLIQDSDDMEVAATQLATTVTALQARVEGAEAQLAEYRVREADAKKALAVEAVDAAIAEGRLPGKNIEIRTFWVNAMSANPESTRKALAALVPNPALKTVITIKHGDTKRTALAEGANIAEQIQLKVSAMRAKNPTLSIEDCYGLAEAENPELFAGATQTYATEEA
jgi:hypothetical protein